MQPKIFTESQIVKILKEAESGRLVKELCREHGMSDSTFYRWRSKYGGMEASDILRLKELEAENAQLKKMFADLSLENMAIKDILGKKL